MSAEFNSQLKLECLRIVVENHKGENRSAEFLLQQATDLFNWLVKG